MSLEILGYQDDGFDLDAVKKLFGTYQQFLDINLDFQGFERELAELPGKYAPPSGNLYLALWEREPIGCTAFYPMAADMCELKRLFVLPGHQGKAVGKQLLERAMQDARARGYRVMRLDSMRRLASAGKLYEKFGFREISPYNQNPQPDAYYMERAL
jgi:GNAT superfamily N-acetyltransferase